METKWIPLCDTKLALELQGNLKSAGRILRRAGFVKKKLWSAKYRRPLSHVDAKAKDLTRIEIDGIGVFGGPSTPAVKKAMAMPTYQELVTALEEANQRCEEAKVVIEDLKEENRQLRSYLPNNDLGGRAKKALAAAGKSMTVYGG